MQAAGNDAAVVQLHWHAHALDSLDAPNDASQHQLVAHALFVLGVGWGWWKWGGGGGRGQAGREGVRGGYAELEP